MTEWATDRVFYNETHNEFRDQVRRFLKRELADNGERWQEVGITDRGFWTRGGALGLLGAQVP